MTDLAYETEFKRGHLEATKAIVDWLRSDKAREMLLDPDAAASAIERGYHLKDQGRNVRMSDNAEITPDEFYRRAVRLNIAKKAVTDWMRAMGEAGQFAQNDQAPGWRAYETANREFMEALNAIPSGN